MPLQTRDPAIDGPPRSEATPLYLGGDQQYYTRYGWLLSALDMRCLAWPYIDFSLPRRARVVPASGWVPGERGTRVARCGEVEGGGES